MGFSVKSPELQTWEVWTRIPAYTLPIQLVSHEDNQVRLFLIERTFNKQLCVCIRDRPQHERKIAGQRSA